VLSQDVSQALSPPLSAFQALSVTGLNAAPPRSLTGSPSPSKENLSAPSKDPNMKRSPSRDASTSNMKVETAKSVSNDSDEDPLRCIYRYAF
jgi:hypothetical protein